MFCKLLHVLVILCYYVIVIAIHDISKHMYTCICTLHTLLCSLLLYAKAKCCLPRQKLGLVSK